MEEYARELLRLSREANLPIMKLIAHLPEEQLLEMTKQGHGEFLDKVAANELRSHIEEGLRKWKDNELDIISNDEIATEDITLGTFIRKKAMMKLLPGYTADAQEMLNIIQEMDAFDSESLTLSTNVHFDILKGKIQEQLHFIEKISNTTPGLTYVYDIETGQVKYANEHYLHYLGYTLEDIQLLGNEFNKLVIHPEDLQKQEDIKLLLPGMSDTDTIRLENRMKNSKGEYRWMRHYYSIFKRNDAGTALEIVGIALDMEHEKRSSLQLAYREEQLLEAQAIGEIGSFEWIFGKDEATTVTPQLLKIFALDDVTDFDSFIHYVHPEDRERVTAAIQKAMMETGVFDCEYRYCKNNVEKIIWSRGIVRYEEGVPYCMKGTIMDVSERHHIIHRLQKSEALYKQAQALSHIGNWSWDLDSDEIVWSEEVYRIYGMEPQPGPHKRDEFIYLRHPADNELVEAHIKALRETHQPQEYNFRAVLNDGTIKHLHVKAEVLLNESGTAAKLHGTLQDVTERERFITRLQNSEALYKHAQAMSHIGNWTWDLATGEVTWSDELFRIYDTPNLTNGKVDLASATAFRHPEDREFVASMVQQVLDTKKQHEYRYRIVTPQGKTKVLQGITEPILDTRGKVLKVIGTVQDVTEDVLISEQIKANEEFITKIADTAPSIITTYNINTGRYNFVSEGISKMLGYRPEEVLKEGISFFLSRLHPDDLDTLVERNNRVITQANSPENTAIPLVEEFKYRVLDVTGKYRWLHTYGTVFDRDAAGKVEQILNVSVDITEQVEAQMELQQKNIELQVSNSSLEDYAYIASHDLKEPLRKITTFTSILMNTHRQQLSPEAQNYLDKVNDSALRMQLMISDLLTVSTISGNKAFEQYSLRTAFEEAMLPLEHVIEKKNAAIHLGDMPEASIVPAQFRQLFQNLLNNSLKFAREGVAPEVQVSARYLKAGEVIQSGITKSARYLEIRFSDNGIGFDNKYAEKIFSIFQRLHGQSKYEGTGIGLAICRKIAENHGGTIWADARPGEGATFTLLLPA